MESIMGKPMETRREPTGFTPILFWRTVFETLFCMRAIYHQVCLYHNPMNRHPRSTRVPTYVLVSSYTVNGTMRFGSSTRNVNDSVIKSVTSFVSCVSYP